MPTSKTPAVATAKRRARPAPAPLPAPRGYHHGDLRAALLDAAAAELDDKGIAGFSLRGTARRAGVSHAAPAHHFPNTEALLSALAHRGFDQLSEAMEREMAQGKPGPQARLASSGRAYVMFARAHPQLFRLMFFGQRLPQEPTECAPQGPANPLALLRSCIEAALGPAASPIEAATAVASSWGLVHGLSYLLIEGTAGFLQAFAEEERQAIIDRAIDQLALAIGPTS
ncbi:TetR/AcrR family transcriptional regulator [Acidovorax sp. SUPP1855]|uniref:TetR/AcrR family transcriptional regulator n=1 Tax=Acidovorax sp. SUPP1855 TaxID=431774 RepID=UPI0023DE1BAF|nr:TetR/AcrR family transcriptional regulator [Acidovorax sp. SUPP1855]GKS84721.1 TetR/AcrR family transcriptional regulator [Acidovorax sp. SUPP1855]